MPRAFAYPLLALVLPLAVQAADPPPARFPIAVKNRWGYIDAAGKTIIEPHFDAAADFAENLAMVRVLDDVGYIDSAGNLAIKPQFVAGNDFSEGLAAVRVDDLNSLTKNPYGFIDTTGKLVIPANLPHAAAFHDGFAYVVTEQNKPVFIDKTGKPLALPAGCRPQASFSEGLALVRNGSKCGFVDTTGKLVIDLRDGLLYSMNNEPAESSFAQGLAPFVETTGTLRAQKKRFGYLDKTGKTVIDAQFLAASPFSENLAHVLTADGRHAYIDKTGKPQFTLDLPDLRDAADFHDSRAAVLIGGNADTHEGSKTGYIDTTGKLIIPATYFAGADFRGGLAHVALKYQSAWIDKDNKQVWISPMPE